MGNTPNNQNLNKDKNENNQNMRVINSTEIMHSQNMEYSNMNNFDVNAKMKSTLKYLEKNNFMSLKFVRNKIN